MTKTRSLIAGALILAALTACGSDPGSVVEPIEATGPADVDAVLTAPDGDVILKVAGAVENTNRGDAAAFDLDTLEALPQVSVTVEEPFLLQDVEFTGVKVEDLMDAVGVSDGASTITTTALDEYVIDIPLSLVDAGTVLLASRANGREISVADGGPIRIIFLGESDFELNTDNWIWSVVRMDVA